MQQTHAVGEAGVGRVDQDDGRVDRNAGQRDDAIQRVERQRVAGDEEAEHHAGKGHWHSQQYQERLPVGTELRGEDEVDEADAQQEQHLHRIQAFVDIVQLAREIDARVGVGRCDTLPGVGDPGVGCHRVETGLVEVRLDRDCALEVVMLDAGGAHPRIGHDQRPQRGRVAAGQGNRIGEQLPHVGQFAGLAAGAAHAQLDLVAAGSSLGHDLAFGMQAHQPGNRRGIEAGCLHRFGIQTQHQLHAAGLVVVGHVPRAVDFSNRSLQRLRGGTQFADVVAQQAQLDRFLRRWTAGQLGKGNLAGAGQGFDVATHGVDDRAHFAHVASAWIQRHADLAIRFAVQRFGVGPFHAGVARHAARLAFREMASNCRFHALGFGKRGLDSAAARHVDADVEQPDRIEGEELRAHRAADDQPQRRNEEHQHAEAADPGTAHEFHQDAGVLHAQGMGGAFARRVQARGAGEVDLQRRHVRGHHPVGLDQAHQQRQRHHQRHQQHELADDAGHEHQRQEGGNRRCHRRQHRPADLAHRVERGGQRIGPARDAVIDGFGDDDRIVDQHAQRNHDAEQHRNRQREIEGVQDGESACQREGNPQADQDRQSRAEKQPAQTQHDQQTQQGVGFHHANGGFCRHGLVVEQHQAEAVLFQRRRTRLDQLVDIGDQIQRVHPAFLGDGEDHRRLAIGCREAGRPCTRCFHRRQRRQRHGRIEAGRQHGEAAQIVGIRLLPDHPHQPVGVAHARTAGKGVAKPGAGRIG